MTTESPSPAWIDNVAPAGRWVPLHLGQLWARRELIWFFAVRDVKVRYKQALLGVGWALLQPLLGALAFTILFHRLAGVDIDGYSYFSFALVGFAVWAYFSAAVSTGTASLLANAELLTKVAFPRIVAPVASMVPGLLDLAIGLGMAMVVGVAGDGLDPLELAAGLPLGLALLLLATVGPVLMLATAIVRYRDVGVAVTFGLQLLLFISPVGFPPELVSPGWRTALYLNPLSGVLGLLRYALTGMPLPSTAQLVLSVVVAGALAFVGVVYFRRDERELADLI